ncbi:MAG: metallophosphoesterase family protein, partial [Verrucomicrobiales bacterium]
TMSLKILHTADWQIGKPFGSLADTEKKVRLQQHRLRTVERLQDLIQRHHVQLVLVAGDLFDSPSPTRSTVSATFRAIGKLGVPVIAIPGNHDFGGPGGPWTQDFVEQEAKELAPNFQILTSPEPLSLPEAVILPAPLMERMEIEDPTRWIRSAFDQHSIPSDRPRLVLAHGSTQGFSSAGNEGSQETDNLLELDRLPLAELDYLALGDWHGTKQISEKAWYAGTPEIDRFPKSADNTPGHALIVSVERGTIPQVITIPTTQTQWHRLHYHFDLESDLNGLKRVFEEQVGTAAAEALVRLELSGQLSIEQSLELQTLLATWEARLIRLKVLHHITESPSAEELEKLTERGEDPLISHVAARLISEAQGDSEDAAIARLALRELFQATLA